MTCPRCNTEWDVSKSPCPRCGLLVHVPGRSGVRPTPSSNRGVPATPQFPRVPQTPQPNGMPPDRQQFNGTSSINPNSVGKMRSVRPQPTSGQQSHDVPFARRQENTLFPSQPNNPYTSVTPYSASNSSMMQNTPPQEETMENSQPLLPIQPQWNQFGTPSSPAMSAIPNTPRPANSSSPDYDNNPFLARLRRDDTRKPGSSVPLTGDMSEGANVPTRNVPHRPQAQPFVNRFTENLLPDTQRVIRPSRLTTDSLVKEGGQTLPPSSFASGNPSPKSVSSFELPQLVPGTILRGGRYRLRELQGRQDWLEGVFEASWIAQDAQRSGSQVMISELVIPDSKSMVMQSTLRNATMALTSVGRHPRIPTLWDAFSDQGRNFFVFEPTEGESLVAYMRRTKRALPEQDVLECCLQMTEILEILVQQSPPLVHGLIRPEHIIIARNGSEYILTNFSIVLAGGATQLIAGIDHSYLTPYIAPEFARGTIDGRSDLYSLLATAYHAVTGSLPVNTGGVSIPQAQRLNPSVSSAFDAILARGLRPIASQRYQRASELRQDLLAMRSMNGTLMANNTSHTEPNIPRAEQPVALQTTSAALPKPTSDTLSKVLSPMMASGISDEQEQKSLLPRPEDLPAMPMRNDLQQSALWLIGILLCLVVIVIVSRGFM